MADRLASNSGSQPGPSRTLLALRFISGKYQGGEFPLDEGKEIVIGRSSDLDMVLVEEMVSRKHARIRMGGGVISIEDLGSTNGTFVNGEKIQKAQLKEGDRVLIGTSILKVVAVGADEPPSRRNLESVAVRRVTARHRGPGEEAPRMTGHLEEIPLPDLMQLFGTSRKSGVLVIRTDARIGRIFLNNGVVHYAVIEGQPELSPLKSIYRMLDWKRGFFELDPPDTEKIRQCTRPDGPRDLDGRLPPEMDELNMLRTKLPPLEARLDPADSARSSAARARCKTPRRAAAGAEFAQSRSVARPQRIYRPGNGADGRRF